MLEIQTDSEELREEMYELMTEYGIKLFFEEMAKIAGEIFETIVNES